MALSNEQIKLLTRVVANTREHELDCDEFLTHLAHWSERVQAGDSLEQAKLSVRHHLSICPECNEEFQMLTDVLKENLGES